MLEVEVDIGVLGADRAGDAAGVGVEVPEGDVVERGALLAGEIDAPPRNLVDAFLGVEQRHRIVGHDLVLHAVEFLLAARHDVGDEPPVNDARADREEDDRRDDRREADAGRLEREEFAVRRHAAEDDHDGGEEAGGNGERECERHAENMSLAAREKRQVGVHELLQDLEHADGDHEEGEHADDREREQDDLAEDVVVDERHENRGDERKRRQFGPDSADSQAAGR